ncbi:MATE family multidrug resistance protein [Chromobacterium alkanivorans]|uniref:MATE family efflux transporter n=1 Tax=Chromobacterium alkanivorans TaxID=1071719 RepID=UPI00216933DB|nr:MATE family efflux transporter [Chromobacterium alkanivorans]MCS3803955.1 MATE family multidrug resistance protein [Chromobacterium alkanivorans]MCS3817940.1 MATE family multidrug resistance protein [Chromobacterium alkanivorans]MCS3875560.1 MATE family multidrug resistance protein [Chromobacterium alkanivorans]
MPSSTRHPARYLRQSLLQQRRLLKSSLPVISFYLAEVAMTLTDAAFVGHLGTTELAAIGLSIGALFPLIFGGMALVSSGCIFVSEAHARGDHARTQAALDLSLWTCIALSPALVAAALLLPAAFQLAGQDPVVVALCAQYLAIVGWSIPAMLGFSVYRAYVSALGANRVIFFVSLDGVLLNAALNYVLVFGALGLPALGLPGAAIGTALSNWAMLFAIARHCRHRLGYRFGWRSLSRLDRQSCRDLVRIGLPSFAVGLFESSLFGVVTLLAGYFGVAFMAATTIAIYVGDLFIILALGIGDLLTVQLAAKAARGDVRGGRQLAWSALLLITALTAPLAALCWWMPDRIAGVFIDTAKAETAGVLRDAQTLLGVLAWFLLADASQIVLSRSLKGLRDTLTPMWIAGIGYWLIGIGGGWMLATQGGLGGIGLWYGLAAGLSLAALALACRLSVWTPPKALSPHQ